jgi:hypothetical protein
LAWPAPLEVLTAVGHGRSYGQPSQFLGRRLPGILQCELWSKLEPVPGLPTAALVTDIGNDLLYESPVDQVAGWVDETLARLARVGARTVVTLLPTESLRGLSNWKFRLFRRLFVPGCRLDRQTVLDRVAELSARVNALARRHGAQAVPQQAAWYGFDPLHFPLARRGRVWSEILSAWNTDGAPWSTPRRSAPLLTIALRARAPHQRWIFSREQRGAQPVILLSNGTRVWLY